MTSRVPRVPRVLPTGLEDVDITELNVTRRGTGRIMETNGKHLVSQITTTRAKLETIIQVEWRTALGCLGFVACKADKKDGWTAYLGLAGGIIESVDAVRIMEYGTKMTKIEASAFFPDLDIDKYVTK